MLVEFQHSYESFRDGRRFGPWVAGDVVDLDAADAEWVERDSPGALVQVDGGDQLAAPPTVAGGARPRHSGDPDAADAAAQAKERLDAESVFRQTATGDGHLPGADLEDDVPDGSAAEVLAWVNNDHDRAVRALEVERLKETPRVTLVAALEKIRQQQSADRMHRGGENRAG